jgi:gamma-D-glutamyl-L-lysine dipeptidyl-peptidase
MNTDIENALSQVGLRFNDSRTQLCEVQASLYEERLHLSGRVLDEFTLQAVHAAIRQVAQALEIEDRDVRVLRKPEPEYRWVSSNLTSLHTGKSFLAEMSSQMLFGMRLEVLQTEDQWAFVRQDDGYMGWTYQPYLTADAPLTPTHLVVHPISRLRSSPQKGSPVLTRVLGGTFVNVTRRLGEWVEIQANGHGWMPARRLRALSDLPQTGEDQRDTIVLDGLTLTGVPYLWGGTSANGIDCSGLSQLLHRWVGVTIPRDADMQYCSGQPVDPPFQPGDLLFFGEKGESRNITHVGISLGGWTILHASRSRNGVYVDDVDAVDHLRKSFYGACSYLNSQ